MIGRTVSHYLIQAAAGRGGMGEVYKARDPRLQRTVALKFPVPHLLGDPRARAYLLEEARAASALDHPNICAIHDLGETEAGELFICMAYYRGMTLKERLARGPISVVEMLDIAGQIAEGLAFAHRSGFIHRDVKPANVMITEEGLVKILDFGLARSVASELSAPRRRVEGTLNYMAPEQVRAEAVDARADIWALGVILFEGLAGKHPFRGAGPARTIDAILKREPPPIRELRAEVPEAVSQIVMRALRKNAGDRYQNADELRHALHAAAAPYEETASHRPSTGPPRELPSVAVRPFRDLASSGDEGDPFCDGLTDELIACLARLGSLRVVGRSSSFRFKSADVDSREMARQLDVGTVLEGSVRRSGNRLRITVSLLRAEDGVCVWSQVYERPAGDIFRIQEEIAEHVASEMKAELAGVQRAVTGSRTGDLAAYNLCLRGRFLLQLGTEREVRQGLELLRHAVKLDGDYARALTALAEGYVCMAVNAFDRPVEVLPLAEYAASRALRVDPHLAEAQALLGCAKALFWRFDDADRLLRAAVELDPAAAAAHHYRALYVLLPRGAWDDAIEEIQLALAADPLSLALHVAVGLPHLLRDEPGVAAERFRAALAIDDGSVTARVFLAEALEALKRYDEARAELETAARLSGRASAVVGALGRVCALQGDRAVAEQVLDELMQRWGRGYVPAWDIAQVHLGLERDATAVRWLHEAVAERHPQLLWLGVRPGLARLRGDAQFKRTLEAVGVGLESA